MNLNEHAQAVLKGYELCMVKADGDFFFLKRQAGCYRGNATEKLTLQMKTLIFIFCNKHLRAVILTQLLDEF